MSDERHPKSALEWVPIVFMALGGLCLFVTILVLILSGHPVGMMLMWGSLGLAAGIALVFLFRLLTRSRKTYKILAVLVFIVVLVGVPVLGITVLSDWFVGVGNSTSGFSTVQPPAFSIYIGFITTFPTLAWSRDRVRTRGQRE